jgi:DNA recombination protein RmuC
MNETLTKEFEAISAKLIKDNTQHLSEVGSQQLEKSLKPLGEKLKTFEERIERSSAERNTLKGELNKLFDLNQKMASEAQNLTSALKGDTKQQGNWGEMILERILERSGLEEGREYATQHSTTGEDGQRLQPDVIINLPEGKHIVVDAKVSLAAYEAFVNAPNEEAQMIAAKQHLHSIKTHIKGLSEKNYQLAKGINSPDFVLLFMPIEPAFSMALQHDPDLFSYAWDRKIVVVSPTTLLATLRTIASIWKQEKQTQNAMKIAEEGGKLHDKFVDFVKDMNEIGSRIEQTSKAYDSAMGKLSTGRGNAIKKADDLRQLGAKTSKQIDQKLLEDQ